MNVSKTKAWWSDGTFDLFGKVIETLLWIWFKKKKMLMEQIRIQ